MSPYTYIHNYTYIHTYIHTCINTHMRILIIQTYTSIHAHTHIHTLSYLLTSYTHRCTFQLPCNIKHPFRGLFLGQSWTIPRGECGSRPGRRSGRMWFRGCHSNIGDRIRRTSSHTSCELPLWNLVHSVKLSMYVCMYVCMYVYRSMYKCMYVESLHQDLSISIFNVLT